MTYAFFIGCKIPFYVPHYETAVRTVCGELGIGLTDIEFNCCGYPMRHQDFASAVLAAARNLALAEQAGLDLITPCKCCFGSFKHALHDLEGNPDLVKTVNAELAKEGLTYKGQAQVKHLLQVLHDDIGVKKLKERVTKPFHGLKAALIYGCHALRPSKITGFDDPLSPSLFDDLVKATGAASLDWEGKLQCCGGPLIEKNQELSKGLANDRLEEAKSAGADYLSIGCTYTQMQMESGLAELKRTGEAGSLKGSLVYPQLLGLAMGLSPEKLGLADKDVDLAALAEFQVPPPEPEKKPKKKKTIVKKKKPTEGSAERAEETEKPAEESVKPAPADKKE